MMDFNSYQKATTRTVKPLPFEAQINHALMGIQTESGELADAFKKAFIYGRELDTLNVREEVGDLLWYISLLCNTMGITMEQAAVCNIEKLRRRYPEKYTNEAAAQRADK